MKRLLSHIIVVTLLLVTAGFLVAPQPVNASCVGSIGPVPTGVNIGDCVLSLTGWLANIAMSAAGAFLAMTGVLLNGTMIATLHMKEIVAATPAIETTWKIIRDFSNIFIIFMLLKASIDMILERKGPGLSELIKSIVIAAILINFSLFFTKLAIDASNLVSLSFYNAITPGQVVDTSKTLDWGNYFTDGGISNIFMQSLKVQQIYDQNGVVVGDNMTMKVILAGIGGSVLMWIVGLSFLVASFAFTLRIGIFLLLLTFSPLPFIAMIIPDAKKFSERWSKNLYAQCIFMPVYLMLMYVAIRIISDPGDAAHPGGFMAFLSTKSTNLKYTSSIVGPDTIGMLMQYVIAFIMINVPLIVALELGGEGAAMASKLADKAKGWGQGAVKGGASWANRNTTGRLASKLAESERFKDIASNSKIGALALRGVRGTATGYDKKLAEQVAARTKFGESLGANQSAVNKLEAEKRTRQATLKKAEKELRDALKSKNAARISTARDSLSLAENMARTAETNVFSEKTRRQAAFAQGTYSGSPETAWMYVARKDKIAAAQTAIKVLEQQKTMHEQEKKKHEENLKKAKDSLEKAEERKDKLDVDLAGADPAKAAKIRDQLTKTKDEINNLNDSIRGVGTFEGLQKKSDDATKTYEDTSAQIEHLKTIK